MCMQTRFGFARVIFGCGVCPEMELDFFEVIIVSMRFEQNENEVRVNLSSPKHSAPEICGLCLESRGNKF